MNTTAVIKLHVIDKAHYSIGYIVAAVGMPVYGGKGVVERLTPKGVWVRSSDGSLSLHRVMDGRLPSVYADDLRGTEIEPTVAMRRFAGLGPTCSVNKALTVRREMNRAGK